MLDKKSILIVDDEASMRDSLSQWLKADYSVTTAKNGQEAFYLLSNNYFNIALVDLKMPDIDGIQVLRKARQLSPQTEIIIMTAYATVESAVLAMKEGAYDYLIKPFMPEELDYMLKKIIDHQSLLQENIYLRRQLESRYSFHNIIGKSHLMQRIYNLIEDIADSSATVLIQGESGTGKELIARAIHNSSQRREKPFIAVSCGAIPDTLLESELFGYERGAFTGASGRKIGRFELAHQGTLFLDEIGEISLKSQVDLLRVLEEKEFRRLGGTALVKVDIRIIAATNRDLRQEVEAGRFRMDLYYRLNIITILLPPLRDRRDDIPLLAKHFLDKFNKEYDKHFLGFSPESLEMLLRYDWPGNVRELENIVEQAVLLGKNQLVLPQDINLPSSFFNPHPSLSFEGDLLKPKVEEYEKQLILDALNKSNGVKSKAASFLGLSPRALSHYLKKHSL